MTETFDPTRYERPTTFERVTPEVLRATFHNFSMQIYNEASANTHDLELVREPESDDPDVKAEFEAAMDIMLARQLELRAQAALLTDMEEMLESGGPIVTEPFMPRIVH